MDKTMVKAMAVGVLRHAIGVAGTWLATQGYMDNETQQAAVGAAMTLTAIVGSVVSKWRAR